MKKILILMLLLLALKAQSQNHYKSDGDLNKQKGYGFIIGGVAFSTAAILEGGSQFGTNVLVTPTTPTSMAKYKYVTPPFWKQTPRNVMFAFGVTLTITGVFTVLLNK
jgi:hypothetical protein